MLGDVLVFARASGWDTRWESHVGEDAKVWSRVLVRNSKQQSVSVTLEINKSRCTGILVETESERVLATRKRSIQFSLSRNWCNINQRSVIMQNQLLHDNRIKNGIPPLSLTLFVACYF